MRTDTVGWKPTAEGSATTVMCAERCVEKMCQGNYDIIGMSVTFENQIPAALLVASREPRGYHNLRVDDHPDPVADLRRIYDLVVQHSLKIEREYGPEGLRLFSRVKY